MVDDSTIFILISQAQFFEYSELKVTHIVFLKLGNFSNEISMKTVLKKIFKKNTIM